MLVENRGSGAAEGEGPADPDSVGGGEWRSGDRDYCEELSEYLGKAGRDVENAEMHKNF